MNIKITADSTCDLPKALVDEFNITIMPLTVMKGGEAFQDGVDITPADIFAHVAAGGDLCTTAAVNMADYYEFFRKNLEGYDALVHVNISAEFSSCYQNACLAAEEFDNVYVIDSRNLSTGHGHVVLEACKCASAGMEPKAIVEEMNDLAPRVDASFLVDRLDFLAKGGRCSSVAALGANLLHLRPCIEVKDGKMHVGKKYRGSFPKCLSAYVKERLEGRDDLQGDRIFLTYTYSTAEESVDAARQAILDYGHFDTITECTAGSTISCHCGPSTLGVLYIHSKK